MNVRKFYCNINTRKFSKQKWYCWFHKRIDCDNKQKNFNKNVTWNKDELNELSKKVKAISTKGLTKDLISKFSILNESKCFSSGIFQSYWVFIPAKE